MGVAAADTADSARHRLRHLKPGCLTLEELDAADAVVSLTVSRADHNS